MSKKIPGLLLPADEPLRGEEVAPGLFVAVDNPYTDRYDYFETSNLFQPKPASAPAEAPHPAAEAQAPTEACAEAAD